LTACYFKMIASHWHQSSRQYVGNMLHVELCSALSRC